MFEYPLSAIKALVDQAVDGAEIGCRRRFPNQVGDGALLTENICPTEVFGHLIGMYPQPGQQFAALGTRDNGPSGQCPKGVPFGMP